MSFSVLGESASRILKKGRVGRFDVANAGTKEESFEPLDLVTLELSVMLPGEKKRDELNRLSYAVYTCAMDADQTLLFDVMGQEAARLHHLDDNPTGRAVAAACARSGVTFGTLAMDSQSMDEKTRDKLESFKERDPQRYRATWDLCVHVIGLRDNDAGTIVRQVRTYMGALDPERKKKSEKEHPDDSMPPFMRNLMQIITQEKKN